MKQILFFLIGLLCLVTVGLGQVSVNNDNSDADPSAMLDVKSTSKGFLVPRMTYAEMIAIPSPATGLMVYCTNRSNYYINKGVPSLPIWSVMNTQWVTSGSDIYFSEGNVGIGTVSLYNKLQVNGNISADYGTSTMPSYVFGPGTEGVGLSSPFPYTLTFLTSSIERARFTSTGTFAIGTVFPASSAQVEIASVSKGFLLPRMTQVQRMAIVAPAEGLLVYQTTTPEGFYYYTGTAWVGLADLGTQNTAVCTDIDGNSYPTIRIGTQEWMAENLRVTKYRNGDAIPNITNSITWVALIYGAYCWYNNDAATGVKYGAMYNWHAVSDSRNICPEGWHVPTRVEWTALSEALGGFLYSGGKLKSLAFWSSPNTDASNLSGFSGLPGGYRYDNGSFTDLTLNADFWTSTLSTATNAFYRNLNFSNSQTQERSDRNKNYGFAVRCVRD